ANGPSSTLGQNAALTLVALKDNKIFYYNGDLDQSLKDGSYGVTDYRQQEGIGDVIRRKQQALDRSYKGGRKELMLLIKPSPGSDYQNVVALLDEALINDIKRYALMDLPAAEQAAVTTIATRPR
ncbi:MAG: hypothetical protein ABUM51_06105, partial [Bacteroidota bacterium]